MKTRARFCLVLACLLGISWPAAAQVSGFVSDPDLRPALKARVELYSPDSPETPRRFEVSERGTFRIEPPGAGLFRLNFIAAFFEPRGVAVYLPRGGEIKIDVRLKPYDWVDDYKNVRLIGDFNGFSRSSGAVALHPLADGTFFADVENSTGERMGYRVIGLVRDSPLSVPGTQFDEIALDGSGRFISVLHARPGKVRIFFDPAALPRSSKEARVIFEPADSAAARIAAIEWEITLNQRNFGLAVSAWRASGHAEGDFRYDWSDVAAGLRRRIGEEKGEAVRQALWIALLDLGRLGCAEVGRETARQALSAVPADSPLWALSPGYLLFDSLQLAGGMDRYGEYFRRAVTANPSREVRALTLERAYNSALERHDVERAKGYFLRLMNEFGDLLPGQRVKARPPETRFAPGKPMPSFEFSSLEDPGQVVNQGTFKGKYFLLDFWAVWCAPCVAETENLEALYSRYRDKGFEILSVSFDQTREDVRKFREQHWRMPWRHAFLGLDQFRVGSGVCDEFELTEIPKAILVGPDGIIVAAGEDARGDRLTEALARLLRD